MRFLENLFILSIKENFYQKNTRKFILFRLYDTKKFLFLKWNKRHLSVYFGMLMTRCKINFFYYKRYFFVKHTLVLKHVKLWHQQQMLQTYNTMKEDFLWLWMRYCSLLRAQTLSLKLIIYLLPNFIMMFNG